MQIINELALSKDLISFPSITPIDAGAINFLAKKLKTLGFKCKILEFKKGKGKPIKNLSTNLIKKFYKQLKGKIPIIGVGGIDSGESAFEKITSGASAVQLYTGMIYKGPTIVKEIKKELIAILREKGFKNISEAVGSNLN